MQNTQPWKCGESPSPSTIGLTRHLPGADDLHAARASCEQEGTKSVCTSCAQTLLHRPLPSAAEQSQLLEVPFLSCILSYNTSLHGWRAYGSFPLKSWRLNTLLQVLGSGSFFSRTHPPARVLLTPHRLGRGHRYTSVCQTEQLRPERKGMGRQGQLSAGCCAWSCHPAHLHSHALEPEHLLLRIFCWLLSSTHQQCCAGELPSSERQLPLFQWSLGTASSGELLRWGPQQLTFC